MTGKTTKADAPQGVSMPLGRAVADILASTLTSHFQATAPAQQALKTQAITAFMEGAEQATTGLTAPLIDAIKQGGKLPEGLAPLLDEVAAPGHQFGMLVQQFFVWGVMFSVASTLLQPFMMELQHHLFEALPDQVISPQIMADLVLRGFVTQDHGAAESKMSGIDAHRFQLLVDATGQPLALQELLLLYRRGQIDDTVLEHGIREGRTRDEWIPYAKELRFAPPGYGAVLEGAVKGHLTTAEATKMLAEAGIDPKNYTWMFESTGNPLSPGEMLDLWNRGQAVESDVIQSMRQGHLADHYIPFALLLRQKWLTGMEVLTAQQVGAMTAPEAQAYLAKLGYSSADAHIYASAGIRYKLDQVIKDTMAAIEDEYQLGGITTAEATSMLGDLQFSSSEAAMILQSVDYKRELSVRNSLLTRVQNMYVKRQIDKAAAQQALLQQKVPVSMATQLLEMWTLAREETVLIPSEAQIRDAFKYGIMDQGSATAYLMQLGYSEYSAWVLLSVTMHAPLPNEPAGAPPPPPPATA